MNVNLPAWAGFGFLLALIVLLIVLIFAISGHPLTRDWLLGLIGLLALARMLP